MYLLRIILTFFLYLFFCSLNYSFKYQWYDNIVTCIFTTYLIYLFIYLFIFLWKMYKIMPFKSRTYKSSVSLCSTGTKEVPLMQCLIFFYLHVLIHFTITTKMWWFIEILGGYGVRGGFRDFFLNTASTGHRSFLSKHSDMY